MMSWAVLLGIFLVSSGQVNAQRKMETRNKVERSPVQKENIRSRESSAQSKSREVHNSSPRRDNPKPIREKKMRDRTFNDEKSVPSRQFKTRDRDRKNNARDLRDRSLNSNPIDAPKSPGNSLRSEDKRNDNNHRWDDNRHDKRRDGSRVRTHYYHHNSHYHNRRYTYYSRPTWGVYVRILPATCQRIYINNRVYYYYGGSYFERWRNNRYRVIRPPIGAIVEYLPDDYDEFEIRGEWFYEVDGVIYGDYYNRQGYWEGYEVLSYRR